MQTLMFVTDVVMAGDGILDWGTAKIQEVGDLFRAASVVAGIGLVLVTAIMSRGAMARIIVAGLTAALLIWIVFNVTDLESRVDNEINGAHDHHRSPAAAKPSACSASPTATPAARLSPPMRDRPPANARDTDR